MFVHDAMRSVKFESSAIFLFKYKLLLFLFLFFYYSIFHCFWFFFLTLQNTEHIEKINCWVYFRFASGGKEQKVKNKKQSLITDCLCFYFFMFFVLYSMRWWMMLKQRVILFRVTFNVWIFFWLNFLGAICLCQSIFKSHELWFIVLMEFQFTAWLN